MDEIFCQSLKDGGLDLIIYRDNRDDVVFFNGVSFKIIGKENTIINEFHKRKYVSILKKDEKLSIKEIRQEEFGVFYLLLNDNSIIQIVWQQMNGEMIQRAYRYSTEDLVYKIMIENYSEADISEDLNIDDW